MLFVKRIKLSFAPNLELEFIDRDRAIKQIYELGEKGIRFPIVVFGPEGCGKTSWLLQAIEVLKDLDYSTIYFNPMRKQFEAEVGVEDFKRRALEVVKQALSNHALAKLVWIVIELSREAIRLGRKRLAIIIDDTFHYVGVKEASSIVKSLLELIEYPPASYDSIVTIAATSEGLSRREIGRHGWALLRSMWNMSRKGFEELYKRIPEPKPPFEDVWRITGGNPRTLSLLYQANWSVKRVINEYIVGREITPSFIAKWREWLERAVENPDTLWASNTPKELVNELIYKNLIIYNMYDRDPWFWIDEPPPKKELEIGIGRYVAWQTPLHREAVRIALKNIRERL